MRLIVKTINELRTSLAVSGDGTSGNVGFRQNVSGNVGFRQNVFGNVGFRQIKKKVI